jgi:hypothetical protein
VEDFSLEAYHRFLAAKCRLPSDLGVQIDPGQIHPWLKPHQKMAVEWAVRGGRRALFESFGLGKTVQQLEILRLTLAKVGGLGLIVAPLGVRQEFRRDAERIGIDLQFVRTDEEVRQLDLFPSDRTRLYLTNYESIRDGKLNPQQFRAASLDEAAILRGFGGVKTFREFMRLFENVPYRFVATATPDPNEYIELLAYSAFLGIMDVSAAKTRFFKRDSTKADKLTLHKHKEKEFWLWVASWALFLNKPSDLGPQCSDLGYSLPPLEVIYHEVKVDHAGAEPERNGQGRFFREAMHGVVDAAREKRNTLQERIAVAKSIVDAEPGEHILLWHDLEAERKEIENQIPDVVTVYGGQRANEKDAAELEASIVGFADGSIQLLAAKPVMFGIGVNMQFHCSRAVFCGVGFKFSEFRQAIARLHRFLQNHPVKIHIIYAESEKRILENLLEKWRRHDLQTQHMAEIIREYGLSEAAMTSALSRSLGCERIEEPGASFRLVNNDSVEEAYSMESGSVHFILTSIPFSTQYEYSPSYNDMGHSDSNRHFWQQMDFLTPHLLRVLKPGRLCAIHVKDRIVPGGITGLGFQTVYPFHCDAIAHYTKHGFAYLGMKTVVTDVVRENNQTYRLGWTEQCKDGTKMGFGMPEYLLLFRKPPTDTTNAYADEPVVKNKARYTRSRWQIDAHGFTRSNGNRLLLPADLDGIPHAEIFKKFRKWSYNNLYDFEQHVALGESLETCSVCKHIHTGQGGKCIVCDCKAAGGRLPVTFMLLQPQSWHPDVYTDITRMRTLNGAQSAKGKEMHLCLAIGSRVLTQCRGYVPIQEVNVGESVLTHMGRWRKVLVSESTGIRPVVTIRAQGVPGLTLTSDHKVWARKSDFAREREYAEKTAPDWIEAGNVLGGYVNFKLPPLAEFQSVSDEKHWMNRTVGAWWWGPVHGPECSAFLERSKGTVGSLAEFQSVSDEKHWWIVGRWLADGHWDGRGAAIISCGSHERTALLSLLGDRAGGDYFVGTAYQIRVLDPLGILKDTLRRCGHGAAGKHLPAEAFSLPDLEAKALLDGYLSGDGHYLESRQRWQATTVSSELALGLCVLAQRVYGAIASVYEGRSPREAEIEGRTVNCQQEWVFGFDLAADRRKHPFVLEDGAWKKVRSIEDAGDMETWNLRVEEDESYTAEGCIVKNCPMQFDLANREIEQWTNPGEVVFDTFAGLGTVPMIAVEKGRVGWGCELSHAYWLDSLVYCKMAEQKRLTPTLFDLIGEGDADEVPIEVEVKAEDVA